MWKQLRRYLAYIIGYNGPRSIFDYTKAKDWVSALSASDRRRY